MLQLDLRGKTALVTGATGQLGRVMAKTLALCGADVAVHFHSNAAKAEEIAAGLRKLGVRAMTVRGDVGVPADVFAMRDRIAEELEAPHIVVCNAVVQYEWKTVLEQPVEDYESQFRSCVLQIVNMAKAFLPAMMERGEGRLIAVNTECSMQCFPRQSAYVAGKRGMDGVVRVLAKEAGPGGVTVNEVAPGWTISDRDREEHTERDAGYEEKVPLRRRGTDQEIANAVAFLASPLASNITGAYLPVCGGNVMPGI